MLFQSLCGLWHRTGTKKPIANTGEVVVLISPRNRTTWFKKALLSVRSAIRKKMKKEGNQGIEQETNNNTTASSGVIRAVYTERQITLYGETASKQVSYESAWSRKDDHIWTILGLFYDSLASNGLYTGDLRTRTKKLPLDKQPGYNTMDRCIKRLMDEKMLRLHHRNVGPTRRRKYYEITDKGAFVYEEHKKARSDN